MSFVHLHTHTVYSLLDGFSNIKKLVKRAKEMEMPALAITDHGTMFGVVEFYNAAREAGIKPIIGVETYMAARRMQDRDPKLDKRSTHLLLLAENETGYKNLLKLTSKAQMEGFYYYPRIDHELLAEHSEGLICTSGCMSAEIPRDLIEERPEEAVRRMNWYYDVFGPDRFFVELQQHNIAEIVDLNRKLVELGARYSAKFVATNDVHYINLEDAAYQDVLLAIQTGKSLNDPDRMRYESQTFYLRSPQEMSRLFAEIPEALSNTLMIAERCNVDLSFKGYHIPEFPVPEGFTAATYLRHLCEEGLEKRYGARKNDPVIRERLNFELEVIHSMGFDSYFLIVWDLCRHARESGIWYNTRGSGAGSLVAYSLFITLVDPIEHHLLFERFLNPGRVSMPDIDLDFRDDRRSEMLLYAAQKYGDDKVAQIITFGTMAARGALRDVGRVMEIPIPEVDKVARLVPQIPGKPVSLSQALEEVPDLKALYDSDPQVKKLVDVAIHMEGTVRNAGTHAAGLVISDRPITEYLPIHRPTSGSEDSPVKTVTQFEMGILDSMGMLKVDFLGLSTLTVMARACEMIKQRHGKEYDLNNIPLDDPETFRLLGEGKTAGVFQLEGTGMTRYVVEMKPKTLDHIIAMVALYRPGPMDFIPSYIRRMHGEEPIEYRHPALEPIFRDTYGIPVYQEQIMRAAVEIGGFTRSESDDLRKAISKKMADKIAKNKEKFIKGAVERGIMDKATATAIFEDWEQFARYGFNKCLPGDVEVLDADSGRLVRLGDIADGKATLSHTLSLNESTGQLVTTKVVALHDNGIRSVYRLKTASNREISATANHPFLTLQGWQWLQNLLPGEQIAVPSRTFSPASVTANAKAPKGASARFSHRGVVSRAINSPTQFAAATILMDETSHIAWDTVLGIEYVGQVQTYDLEIAEHHNFVANDIIVHNSHAADYGLVSVQTAYLKAHYPAEYMSALMSVFKDDSAKISLYIAEARSMGIEVLPPSINHSDMDFTIEDLPGGKTAIRFGMSAIKNVGAGPVEQILKGRRASGRDVPFRDLNDLAQRVDLKAVGKRALECLIKVGAFDGFGERAALLAALDQMVAASASHFKAAESGQMSLFGAATGVQAQSIVLGTEKTNKKEALAWERELIGLYLSDHPLKEYETTLTQGSITNSLQLNDLGNQHPVRVAGLVVSARPYKTKTDKMMGFVTLEDLTGNIELVIFPKSWEKYRPLCEEGKVILAVGKVDAATTPPKVLVDEIRTDFTMFVSAEDVSPVNRLTSSPVEQVSGFPVNQLSSFPVNQLSSSPVNQFSGTALNRLTGEPDNRIAPQPENRKSAQPENRTPAEPDNLPPEPDFPDDWHLNEPAPVYHAAPPTPMDDMLEMERLTPLVEPVKPMLEMQPLPPSPLPASPLPASPLPPSPLPPSPPSVVTLPPIVPPNILAERREENQTPRMMTIILRPSGDPERDRRRIKNIYFILISKPGKDRFQFQIFEGGKGHLIDFPNDSTCISPELLVRLKNLLGEETWRIEEITFQ